MSTHYEMLGVPHDASRDELAKAYRAAARRAHPDTGGTAEEFAAVTRAWEVLGDPASRADYDRELRPDDAWAAAGWGRDDATQAPEGHAEAAPDARADQWASGWGTEQAGAVGAARGVDPFSGGPVELVPITLPPLRNRPPSLVADVVLGAAMAGAAIGTVLLTAAGLPGGDVIVGALAGLALAAVFLGLAAVVIAPGGVAPPSRDVARFLAYGPVALVLIAARAGVALLGAVGLAALSAVLFVWLSGRRRRRHHGSLRLKLRQGKALAELRESRERAERWNAVREACGAPGARIVRIDKRVGHQRNVRRVMDARTRKRSTVALRAFTVPGTWAVIDENDDVLCTAHGLAPRDWESWLPGGTPGTTGSWWRRRPSLR